MSIPAPIKEFKHNAEQRPGQHPWLYAYLLEFQEELSEPVKKAYHFLYQQLRGKERKKGGLIIDHPYRMLWALQYELDNDQQIACLLHDLIEDGYTTANELRKEGIPEGAIAILDSLTHRKSEGELYFDYIQRLSKNPKAIDIKLADIEDNKKDLDPASDLYKKYYIVQKYLLAVKAKTIEPGSPIPIILDPVEQETFAPILRKHSNQPFPPPTKFLPRETKTLAP